MKLVIGDPASGKSYTAEVQKGSEGLLIGKKVGDTFEAGSFGAAGYTLKITGGSDTSGFPMRHDIDGPRRAKVLLSEGPGFNPSQKGERQRRVVRGKIISDQIEQINCKVEVAGPKPLNELFVKKEGEGKKKEEGKK